jgi:anti-sigma regulatory factor (Ser/Thr protein kinase)
VIRVGTAVSVLEQSQVAEARRLALTCASELQLDEVAAARAALVATELATNLIKHGGGGTILFGDDEDLPGSIEIAAFDKGRGLVNVSQAMLDGYSTAGSQGTGLGAIERAAVLLDIYSVADKGTVVVCRVENDSIARRNVHKPLERPRLTFAGISVPKHGETANGDAWSLTTDHGGATLAVVDGLGHGAAASAASSAGIRVFREQQGKPLDELMRVAHGALRPTRGAAVGLFRIEPEAGRLDFAGIGNIAGAIFTDVPTMRRVMSHNGIVGHELRKVQVLSYPWPSGATLVAHSDGLSANWNLEAYPGLQERPALTIAAVLFRDFCRGSDDATIVVGKG